MRLNLNSFIPIALLFFIPMLHSVAAAETSNTIQVANGLVAISADGQCSLIEAIENDRNNSSTYADCASGTGNDDVVTLAAGGSYTFTPTTAEIEMNSRQITIDGNGATLDHTGAGFFVVNGTNPSLTLRNITLEGSNGNVAAIHGNGHLHIADSMLKENVSLAANGGAINMVNGSERQYSFERVEFEYNVSTGSGGAIYINSSGENSRVDIHDVTFNENGEAFVAPGITSTTGGAVSISNSFDSELKIVTITNSTFSNNDARQGGGLSISAGVQATIRTTTFDNNTAQTTGGGLLVGQGIVHVEQSTFSNNVVDPSTSSNMSNPSVGGGIWNFLGTLTIKNSTFSGNQADAGGALANKATSAASTVALEFVTMTKNVANARGGAIFNEQTDTDVAGMTVRNSYIAGNSANGGFGNFDCRNDGGTLSSFGSNIESETALDGCPFEISASASDISPALSSNGGATKTHAIPTSSVARNKIPAGAPGCDASVLDQRGYLRSSGTGTAACDIGAYESGANTPPVAPTAVSVSSQMTVNNGPLIIIASLLSLALLTATIVSAGTIKLR